MQEVTARLRFISPSLGDCRGKKLSKMLHAPDGRVMFLASWWQSVMRYAAKVLNRHQDLVRTIDWDPIVEGHVQTYRRHWGQGKFQLHEAFLAGDEINVNAVLPDGMNVTEFTDLLSTAGTYRGISPYHPDTNWGRFEVVTVTRRRRKVTEQPEVVQK